MSQERIQQLVYENNRLKDEIADLKDEILKVSRENDELKKQIELQEAELKEMHENASREE